MKTAAFFGLLVVLSGNVAAHAGGPPPMYAVVSNVETTQCKGKLSSIRITGYFTREAKPHSSVFTKPVFGTIEFGYGSDEDAPKWQKAVGTGKAVAIGSCGEAGAFLTAKIQPADKADAKEKLPETPYPKDVLERFGDLYAHGDFNNQPEVKALLAYASAQSADKPDFSKFIRESIFAGLKEDGVPRELAAIIAKSPDFLGKCSLCMPARQGFTDYAALRMQPDGKGIDPDLHKRLVSKDDDARRGALRELVAVYIGRGYSRSEMSKADRKAMEAIIAEHRSIGERGLPQAQSFCPSCDGACLAVPKKK